MRVRQERASMSSAGNFGKLAQNLKSGVQIKVQGLKGFWVKD